MNQTELDKAPIIEAECGEPDWDGYGVEAISIRAAETAKVLIKVLPDGVPMPEVAVEPDGSICLDWIKSPYCLFSVSIGSTDRGHGVARFDFERIPQKILHGAAFLKAKDIRAVTLDVEAHEPSERHASKKKWPSDPSDPALQKAKQKELEIALAGTAVMWKSP